MYDRILIGVDFSDASVEAIRWAVSRFPRAELTLFHAIEPFAPPGWVREALSGLEVDARDEKALDARANLEQLVEGLRIDARVEVRRGWTPESLNRAAHDRGARLIVIGAHQKRIWPGDELGNAAAAIVKRATLPVLVWRPIRHERDKTVLAAVDLREGSAPIAETAGRYASYFGTRLLLLHALTGTLQAYLRAVSTPSKVEDVQRAIERGARDEALQRLPLELAEELDVQVMVVRGRPVSAQILGAAEREAVDLIVIGQSHAPGFGGLALLGGVTEQVIRSANCSVLCVPR